MSWAPGLEAISVSPTLLCLLEEEGIYFVPLSGREIEILTCEYTAPAPHLGSSM